MRSEARTRFLQPSEAALRLGLLIAASMLLAASDAAASNFARPLSVLDELATNDRVTVSTPDFEVVFERKFNGGPSVLYDLAFDPGRTDNLSTASGGGFYSNGVLFDYDVYLGTSGANQQEYMTTMGTNATFGSLVLSILENTQARVRILQSGRPRLNNGSGPPGSLFPELPLISFTTVWTVYPTGKVAIDFVSTVDAAGMIVDAGPGGGSAGIDTFGTTLVTAVGGADFRNTGVWAGDTIESAGGGWGPILVTARLSATQLQLASAVPAGTAQDFTVRRANVVNETISIHGDGDPTIVSQCSDPATSHWQGGSDTDPLWNTPLPGDPCMTLLNGGQPWNDYVLAHWTRTRGYGSLLAFFEPWSTVNYGAYNDLGFTDISYTQLGRSGIRPAEGHDRHFLAQMGSSDGASALPTIKSVADALPYADDYVLPFADALVGTLATGPEIEAPGFEKASGAYRISAFDCGGDCREAVIRFDASAGGRSADAYPEPVVHIANFAASTPGVSVAISSDGGTSFSPLGASLYNITGLADESETGVGERVFQYLGTVPSTATGASAVAFRFADATTSTSTSTTSSTSTTTTLPAGVGITGKKLIIVDKVAFGSAKIVYIAKDAAAAKGTTSDPAQISATFDYQIPAFGTSGSAAMPSGAGWVVNKPAVAKYVNKGAPSGGAVKVGVIKPGKLLKAVLKDLGDTGAKVDIYQGGATTSPVDAVTQFTVVDGGDTIRRCGEFTGCVRKLIAGGTGAKVVCKTAVPGTSVVCP